MIYLLYAAVIISSVCSVLFSFRSRRATDPKVRGLNAARMNISMGALLLSASLVQFVLFEPDTVRIIVGSLFLVIGIFNLFAGLRNLAAFNRQS